MHLEHNDAPLGVSEQRISAPSGASLAFAYYITGTDSSPLPPPPPCKSRLQLAAVVDAATTHGSTLAQQLRSRYPAPRWGSSKPRGPPSSHPLQPSNSSYHSAELDYAHLSSGSAPLRTAHFHALERVITRCPLGAVKCFMHSRGLSNVMVARLLRQAGAAKTDIVFKVSNLRAGDKTRPGDVVWLNFLGPGQHLLIDVSITGRCLQGCSLQGCTVPTGTY